MKTRALALGFMLAAAPALAEDSPRYVVLTDAVIHDPDGSLRTFVGPNNDPELARRHGLAQVRQARTRVLGRLCDIELDLTTVNLVAPERPELERTRAVVTCATGSDVTVSTSAACDPRSVNDADTATLELFGPGAKTRAVVVLSCRTTSTPAKAAMARR